jgi:hypothetical protein
VLALPLTVVAQDLPPMPKVPRFKSAFDMSQGSGARALLVVVPPMIQTVRITWQHPDASCTFNVYSAPIPSLAAMTLLTNVATRSITLPIDRTVPMRFFSVKALKDGLESDWARR